MSYASVAAHNAPPPEEQPRPDQSLLNTTPPHHSLIIDDSKVALVPPEFKEQMQSPTPPAVNHDRTANQNGGIFPSANSHRRKSTPDNPSWLDLANHYLIRPGVAGGLIGLGTLS